MVAVGEIVELQVGDPAHGGACVARSADGQVIFVRGALPGERVRAELLAVQSSLAWANTVDVEEAAPDRQPHVWEAGEATGAADLGHVKPAAQREWKSKVLADQLRRIGGPELADRVQSLTDGKGVRVQAAPGDALPVDTLLGRRTRISLVADQDGVLGMRKYRSHEILPIETMPLGVPELRFDTLGIQGRDRWASGGTRWQPGAKVELIAPTAGVSVVCVETTIEVKTKRGARPGRGARGSSGRQARGQAARGKRTSTRTVTHVYTDPGKRTQTDKLEWQVEAAGTKRTYTVSAGGFWQTHRAAPGLLAERVLAAANPSPGDTGLELYSGAGLFTGFLMDRLGPSGELRTLEASPMAVKDAARNFADEITSEQLQLFTGKADEASICELAGGSGQTVDFIVLDPPRSGAGGSVIRGIDAVRAARVVLVSCDPAAAARDLADLTRGNYRLDAIEAWDLFPHTHHFETISVLSRK